MFRYELIWEKDKGSNPLLANKMPMKAHENICIFYDRLPTYNPQFTYGKPYIKKQGNCSFGEVVGEGPKPADKECLDGKRFPKSVIKFSRDMNRDKSNNHPTQKPLALFEYLIKTYTLEGQTVLDPFGGSGTSSIAARNLNRQFIVMEKEEKYYNMILERLGIDK